MACLPGLCARVCNRPIDTIRSVYFGTAFSFFLRSSAIYFWFSKREWGRSLATNNKKKEEENKQQNVQSTGACKIQMYLMWRLRHTHTHTRDQTSMHCGAYISFKSAHAVTSAFTCLFVRCKSGATRTVHIQFARRTPSHHAQKATAAAAAPNANKCSHDTHDTPSMLRLTSANAHPPKSS